MQVRRSKETLSRGWEKKEILGCSDKLRKLNMNRKKAHCAPSTIDAACLNSPMVMSTLVHGTEYLLPPSCAQRMTHRSLSV